MGWFKVEGTTADHRKMRKLARRLGCNVLEARGVMLGLWCRVVDEAPDGDLDGWDAEDVAVASGWPGDEDALVDAMLAVGLLDEEDGRWLIHDWMEYAHGYKRAQQKKKERAGRPRPSRDRGATVARDRRATGDNEPVPRRSDGTERTGRDGTGQDETPSDAHAKKTPKKTPIPPAPKSSLPSPPDDLGVQPETWDDWEAHRKSIKAPLTPGSAKETIRRLVAARQDGYDADLLLGYAMGQGWRSVHVPDHDAERDALRWQPPKRTPEEEDAYIAKVLADQDRRAAEGRDEHEARQRKMEEELTWDEQELARAKGLLRDLPL